MISNDPNPLDAEMPCGMQGCNGMVVLANDGMYRCDSCDFEMSYEDMKGCDLFARHLKEHYGVTPEDLDEA